MSKPYTQFFVIAPELDSFADKLELSFCGLLKFEGKIALVDFTRNIRIACDTLIENSIPVIIS